ncbi:MAG: GDP-mannose 4,6-dehydratase [Pyrinomonadaceae bacterium]
MSWFGKKVLVTGAGGFIGSHLTEELVKQGAEVRALVRYNSQNSWANLEFLSSDIKSEIEVLPGEIRDPFFVDRCIDGVSTVFHLASLIAIPYSYVAPHSYIETNVMGTLNVLQAARRYEVEKTIHTSTSETYGTARYTPMDEQHPLQGQSPYSASKIGADKLVESFHRSFELPVATLRPFNTFGPRQSARAVIPTIVAQALTRDHIELGSLTPVRDLTFVSDTVRGFLKVAEIPEAVGETINIGNGSGVTILELAEHVLATLNLSLPVVAAGERVRPEHSEVFTLICDNGKARRMLDWQPLVSLDDGLSAVIDWVREHLEAYKTDVYNV